MSEIDERLTKLETAYRETLARWLALETVCLALFPTVCFDDPATSNVLSAAETAFDETLRASGSDDEFAALAVTWFQRMRLDAVIAAGSMTVH